jgi:protoporphyrinogen/coproporphyrinogen III oxidase
MRRSAEIGIVGAGCAGLSAAETLRDLGYERITILERRGRAGGKSHSFVHHQGTEQVVVEGGTV